MTRKRLETESASWNFVDAGRGPALLLVHGFPLDHTMWAPQVPEFARRHRVLCPDLPGFGGTRYRDEPAETSMAEMADQLAELLDALGVERVAFCGLSMGGYIGWQFWERHRERVSHLIACHTRTAADSAEVARGRRILAEGVLQSGTSRIAEVMVPKLLAQSPDRPDLREELTSLIGAASPESVARGQRAMAARPAMDHVLARLACPVLFVAGSEDSITPADEMRSMAERAPGSELVVIAGAGHLSPLEQPDAFQAAVQRFFDES